MADADVPITAGAGTKIDTRTVGAGTDEHRQVVVVGDPATAANVASADATNGLDVDVTRVIPGTSATHLGKAEDAGHTTGDTGVFMLGVANEAGAALSGTDLDYTPFATDMRGRADVLVRQPQFWHEVDVPGVAAASHTAGDQLGTLITISNAARFTGGGGFINSIQYFDDADLTGAIDVVFFNNTPTLAADDAVYAISDAHGRLVQYVANITYVTDFGAQRYGQLAGISVPYFCTGTSLFVALITRTTFVPTAAGLRIRFALTRD